MADREPQRPDDRPTVDMTDSRRSERTNHAAHDLHVLAAAADRSVEDTTRIAAEQQVAECRECAALFADLRLISSGLGELPRELAVTRDFRISPERAAQLRPAGWRGVLQGLLGSGPSLRPFAGALTTLGIAGLLLTVGLPGILGGLGSAASSGAGGAAPERNALTVPTVTSSSEAAGQSGSGKSGDTASPVAPPAGAAASPAIDRGLSGSPDNLYGYLPSGAPGAAGATDATGSPSPQPEAASSSLSVPGILAAISLGVLLLGLVLLIRSRARPFDSAG